MDRIVEAKIISPEHHFIYSEPNESRTDFLKQLELTYPLVLDTMMPRITYVSNIGLPKMDIKDKLPKYPIEVVCQEYVIYSIALKVIEQILNSKSYEEIAHRSKDLFALLNNHYFIVDSLTVRDYEELKQLFERVQESFKKHYESYCSSGEIKSPILTSFSLKTLLDNLPVILNNIGGSVILLDNKEPMNEICYQAINSLIRDIRPLNTSFNVATSFDDWASYYTFAGEFINYREDYQIIDLDGNFSRAQEAITKKYSIDL